MIGATKLFFGLPFKYLNIIACTLFVLLQEQAVRNKYFVC